MEQAAAQAHGKSEEEAVANLTAGYQTMMRTAAIAQEDGDTRAAARFRRKARRQLAALRLIARGANALDAYERVHGSRPWSDA
ncbi:MAG: hypothetical protein AAB426_11280 [Myxococcota bacterium]